MYYETPQRALRSNFLNILGMRDGLEITGLSVRSLGRECDGMCGMGEEALGRRPSRAGLARILDCSTRS